MNINSLYLRNFEERDTSQVTSLIHLTFGTSYIKSKPGLFLLPVLLVVIADTKVVGFCSGYTSTENTGTIDIIVVHPDFQKKKLGTDLFKKAIFELSKLNVKQFLLFHWERNDFPEPKYAIKQGFSFQKTIPEYWKEESLKLNYDCAECGPPPCQCVCSVYIKN